MNHGDTVLAATLRQQLSERIELELTGLVASPTDRAAGRIEAMRDVLGLIDGTYSKLNDIRPTNPEKK